MNYVRPQPSFSKQRRKHLRTFRGPFLPTSLLILGCLLPSLAQAESPTASEATAPQAAESETTAPASTPLFSTMLLVEGTAQYGAITLGHTNSQDDANIDPDIKGGALFSVQGTIGFMPSGSAFTLAGRLDGGTYLRAGKALPKMGVSMLFGANFSRADEGRSFSYALGGVGVDYLPTEEQDLLTLHFSGGSVVRGFDFGLDLNIGANDEFAIAMLGLHFGWARLF